MTCSVQHHLAKQNPVYGRSANAAYDATVSWSGHSHANSDCHPAGAAEPC